MAKMPSLTGINVRRILDGDMRVVVSTSDARVNQNVLPGFPIRER